MSPSPTLSWAHAHQLILVGEQPLPAAPGADVGSLHDSRTSTALCQLADLGRDPDPSRWGWSIATPDPEGRLRLSTAALRAVGIERGQAAERRGRCHRVGLVVRSDGAGAPLPIDRRGRITLPTALRHPTQRAPVIGANSDNALLVIAPTTALDGLGDLLTGSAR